MPEKSLLAMTNPLAYGIITPSLEAILDRNHADTSMLTLEDGAQHSSVFLLSETLCRLALHSKTPYLSILSKHAGLIPEGAALIESKTPQPFAKIAVPNEDALRQLLPMLEALAEKYIDNVGKDFDCCSRVEACSDAKQCLHPDKRRSMYCGYKKIMKSGQIYYGQNRNV